MKKIILVAILSIFSSSLNAGGGKCSTTPISEVIPITTGVEYYIGFGATTSGIKRFCDCATQRILRDVTYGGLVIIGAKFNKYISVEARWTNVPIEKDFSTTKHYGLVLKPTYPITKKIIAYGTLGYGQTDVEGAGLNNYDALSQKGFTFGGGVDYRLSSSWSIWADWENLLFDVSVFKTNANLVSIGTTYHF